MKEEFITNSFEDTQKLGEEFVSKLEPGDILYLYGDLGSGKTTFVKGIASGLGIKSRIISPTFVVLRTHLTSNKKIKKIYHLDLYRLENKKEVENIALDDLFSDTDTITIIEWPELLSEYQGKNIYKITFSYGSENTRKINISNE